MNRPSAARYRLEARLPLAAAPNIIPLHLKFLRAGLPAGVFMSRQCRPG